MATMQMRVRPEDLSQLPKGAERIPDPGILVIFGASGDLTKRKLLPALFHLWQSNLLPQKFSIVGVARRPLSEVAVAPASSNLAVSTPAIPSSPASSPRSATFPSTSTIRPATQV